MVSSTPCRINWTAMTASSNPSRRDRKRRPVCPKKAVTWAAVGGIACGHDDKQRRSRQWVDEDEERGEGYHRGLGQGTEVRHDASLGRQDPMELAPTLLPSRLG